MNSSHSTEQEPHSILECFLADPESATLDPCIVAEMMYQIRDEIEDPSDRIVKNQIMQDRAEVCKPELVYIDITDELSIIKGNRLLLKEYNDVNRAFDLLMRVVEKRRYAIEVIKIILDELTENTLEEFGPRVVVRGDRITDTKSILHVERSMILIAVRNLKEKLTAARVYDSLGNLIYDVYDVTTTSLILIEKNYDNDFYY